MLDHQLHTTDASRPVAVAKGNSGRWRLRSVALGLTACGALTMSVLGWASTAAASPANIHIAGTGGQGVYIRASPDTSQPGLGWLAEGSSPDYHCFTYGQMVGNVNVWFKVTNGGVTGYYSSFYDDSSYHSEADLGSKYGIPKCEDSTPAPPPTPAPAENLVYTVYNAAGGIFYRNSPRWSDTPRRPGVGVYDGDRVRLICGAVGDPVGPGRNTAWSFVENLSRPGVGRGWVSEHYVQDGAAPNQFAPGEPTTCPADVPGGSGPPSAAAGSDGGAPNAFYDRSAAVVWAKAHARDLQAFGAMCTWFVSRALWAGGFPRDSQWTSAGVYHYGHFGSTVPGSKAAWWLPDFLSNFKAHFQQTQTDITANLRTNAVPDAEIGDLILYDWGRGEGISHVAMVVDIARGQYPEVAEMGQYDFDKPHALLNVVHHIRSPYVERGWTWSAVHGMWLQHERGNSHMKAYLLHISGGYTLPTF